MEKLMAQGTPVAQSGGINHTFGGGKGGTKQTKTATRDKVLAKGKNARGLTVTVREAGGDNALVGGRGGRRSSGRNAVKNLGRNGAGGGKS
jgi:hypothetical protein